MNYKLAVKIGLGFVVFLIVILDIWLAVNYYGEFFGKQKFQANIIGNDFTNGQNLEKFTPKRDWSLPDLKISAKAAVCAEIGSSETDKFLFNKNGGEKMPVASLTKLMSALIVLKNYDLNQLTTISEQAVEQEGGQGLLRAGEKLSLENLLYIMLIESSNDAAFALAEIMGVEKFVDLMNLEALKLGMEQSYFADPSGVSSDNYSAAEDLVKLTKYLLKEYPLVWEILSYEKFELRTPWGFHHELLNTNELLGKIPDILGGKTGETDQAKGCLLLILKNHQNGNYLVYVILGSGDRFGEAEQLIDWVNKAYQW